MNSSLKTLHTLILLPIAAGLLGILLMLILSQTSDPHADAGRSGNNREMARSGDGLHSFQITRPIDAQTVSFEL